MVTVLRSSWVQRILWASLFVVSLFAVALVSSSKPTRAENERVITVYHDNVEQTIVTDARTVGDALKRAHVDLNKNDSVEPSTDTVLDAPGYSVNVYRARPVLVVDGVHRETVMTAHTSAREIAQAAGVQLFDEDTTTTERIDNFISDGAVGLKMTIHRATPMNLVLYGQANQIRTQAKTVGELMKQKHIVLSAQDGASLAPDAPITAGMTLDIWRNGAQTVTVTEDVPFTTKQIRDADKPIGYKQVQDPGTNGKKVVTYQVEMKNGVEVSRTVIQSVVTQDPKEQTEVIGAKPNGSGLSKAKGVNFFTDSKGVQHRETYYDLPMGKVMSACGGSYTVRADGVKVDQNGYILIAANLNRYPRCSLVETSLGLGKVYDTGGFVSTYPDGFDLATDWSNYDGN